MSKRLSSITPGIVVLLLLAVYLPGTAYGAQVSQLVKQLASKNERQRWSATVEIWSLDSSAILEITKCLADKDPKIRLAAVTALAEMKNNATVSPLAAALKDSNPKVRDLAIETLRSLKTPDSREALSAASRDENKSLAAAAKAALERKSEREMMTFAVDSSFRGEKGKEQIIADLGSADSKLRLKAVDSLSSLALTSDIVDAIIPLLKDKDERIVEGALDALVRANDPRVFDIIASYSGNSSSRISSTFISYMLDSNDPRAESVLLDSWKKGQSALFDCNPSYLSDSKPKTALKLALIMITDANADRRREAAQVLKELAEPECFEPLMKAAQDKSKDVRCEAVEGLCRIGDPRAIPALLGALKDTGSWAPGHAARALGDFKAAQAVEPILVLLKNKKTDSYNRFLAARALGNLGNKKAIASLIDALRDPDSSVRDCAASSLGQLKAKQAVPKLLALMKDKDNLVRGWAASALGQIGDMRAFDAVLAAAKNKKNNPFEKSYAISALGGFKCQRAYEALISIIDDADYRSAAAAATGLARLGDKRATSHIIPLLALGGSGNSIGPEVVAALETLGDKRAAKPLIGALKKGWSIDHDEMHCVCEAPLRDLAASALEALDSPDGNEFLLDRLTDGDFQVIQGAYRFYIEHGVPDCEAKLIKAIDTAYMAKDYMLSGNPKLAEAAKTWLDEHPPVSYGFEGYDPKDAPRWNSKAPLK